MKLTASCEMMFGDWKARRGERLGCSSNVLIGVNIGLLSSVGDAACIGGVVPGVFRRVRRWCVRRVCLIVAGLVGLVDVGVVVIDGVGLTWCASSHVLLKIVDNCCRASE